jgi:hypothetical protein
VPFQLYADDLKIYNVLETNEDCLKLQRNIDLIQNWARTNNLLLNINKCNVVSYSRRDTIIKFNYSIENSALQRVNEFKDLGVVSDSKLTFRRHVEYVLSKSLGFVIRNGKLFDNPQTLLCLYKTYVRSTLEYASIVWSPCYKVHTWSLEKVQRRFAKSFMYFSSDEYPQRGVLHETFSEQVQIPSLASRRKLASIKFL